MKNSFIIILFILVFPFIGFSQDIQYYRSIADTTHNKTLKLEAIDSVLSKTFGKDNDTFIVFSIQFIKLAKEMDSIELAAKKAMNLQHILTAFKNDPRKAITIIDEVLAYKYKIKDSFLLGGLYLKRGGANYRIDLQKAIKDYSTAIHTFSKKDSIYVADAFLFRGQAFSNLGKFVPAGEDFKSAYTYYENLKDYEYMQFAHQGNITMYSRNGFFDKAKQERDILIKKLIELNLDKYLSTSYYNQSVDYKKRGNTKLQLKYLLKAEDVINKNEGVNDMLNYLLIHSKLTEYYCYDFEIDKAEKHVNLLDGFIENIKSDPLAESYYYGAKAVFNNAIGDFDKALEYAKMKMEIVNSLGYEEDKMEAHHLLSDIYYNLEEYNKSLENKNKYYVIKDSIYSQSSANSLAYYQTLYETEKKEKELVEKNTSIQLLEKDSDSFKKLSLIIGIVLVLLFGLILLYRNQLNLENKKELQEKFSQDLLQSQENERKRISKDLHDGLGQKLLIIKNKLINSGNNNTKELVEESIEEVRLISRDLHPFQLQELGITKAIEYTINQIDENTTLFISSEIENIDNLFAKEQEVNIYRIVQESLSNIIKHAQAEAIKVSIIKTANSIIISIKDNGIGYNFSEKYNDSKSLGLKTLLERTKFLNGQMKVHSKEGDGTLIEYTFPIL
ncbi:MAG: hypothetical protein IMY67_08660 [Bacteroidetes bacterium]|nr:hypothetical protein [Bacteroidota bacterium]